MTPHIPEMDESCTCFNAPSETLLPDKELGMDERYAYVSIQICRQCGQHWLRYHYELEAFTASGRWYLGAITPEQAALLTAGKAKAVLEGLSWYFYGGSYFGGRSGRTSGDIP